MRTATDRLRRSKGTNYTLSHKEQKRQKKRRAKIRRAADREAADVL